MRKKALGAVVVVLVAAGGWLGYRFGDRLPRALWPGKQPIRIGILHSLTGTMSISEKSVVDATLMAIEEINQEVV